jgi:nicotinate-nucleotide--dimethylbenzimidazole phosphoribosyltransferase
VTSLLPHDPIEPAEEVDPLAALASDIDWTDAEAETRGLDRLKTRSIPGRQLGRLPELAAWMAGVQAVWPPHEPERVRLVAFAGDHGIAAAGVSAFPAGSTATRAAMTRAGDGFLAALADAAGVGIRVADVSIDSDEPDAERVRRSSGRIDRENALSLSELQRAVALGVALADEEIDAGADLLILADIGAGSTTVAAAIVATLTSTEPVRVVGRGSGIDDAGWISKVAAIRDARRRGMPPARDSMADLLVTIGGADFAAMTGFLLRAAARRTPVLLDGLVVCTAALLAREVAPRAIRWWQAAHLSTEPAHAIALERLHLEPLINLGIGVGEGTGALLALPLLRAAVRICAEDAGYVEPVAVADDPVDDEVVDVDVETGGWEIEPDALDG